MKARFNLRFVFLLGFVVVFFISFVFAAKHNGKCVAAFVTVKTEIGCKFDGNGLCRGAWSVAEHAVAGYCSTEEAGECYDSTVILLIADQKQGSCYEPEESNPPQCVADGSTLPPGDGAPRTKVQTPSCI